MSWILLVAAGVMEAVWAAALAASHGFTRRVPTALFVTGLVLSTGGLAVAMRDLPAGTAYAVWVGTGATLTVIWEYLTHQERPTLLRVSLLALLVRSVVGLKAVS